MKEQKKEDLINHILGRLLTRQIVKALGCSPAYAKNIIYNSPPLLKSLKSAIREDKKERA